MLPLKNQRIIANAGSGKTHRLVSRYLDLLKRGTPAERIIALTFTRKAAGEFLDRIFQRLCGGAEKGDDETGLTAAECSAHLRQLVEKLPRLALGTLDGFFGRMLRAFPFECGLAGEITILDSHALAVSRREALEEAFRSHAGEEAFEAFLDLIRRQNRNSEGRNVTETLARQIEALHEGFLMTPADRPWGDRRAIWPGGSALLDAEEPGLLAAAFAQVLYDTHSDMTDEYRAHWEALLDGLRGLRTGSAVPERVLKFAVRATDPPACSQPPGGFYLTVYRAKRFVFSAQHRELAASLGRAVLKIELEGRLARSRALYELVDCFEQPYQRLVREAGRLTFADITGLLAAAEGATWRGTAAKTLDRQQMDFRMDATYDHWLLDEFQDTSRLQWQALRNLIDEVVQSDTGQRSFFYVGDTKQAIYTWRGGDPWLFDEIAEYYNATGTDRIDTGEALAISRRSVPEILETVNRLFDPSHLERLREGLGFPAESLNRWRAAWREHQPFHTESNRGCVKWQVFETSGEGKRRTLDREAARLIAEINPLARGLSCAVLVQTNAHAATMIEALRAAGLEARSEGRFNPCTDNDLGMALVSLLRAIAHPSDLWALRHVEMTPLAALSGENFDLFRVSALHQIRGGGFAAAITAWLKNLPLKDNHFALGRAADFLRAAEEFDAADCGGSCDEFILFLQNRAAADEQAANAVRVLTVHAAKGLDFDMVVLPDAGDGPLATRRDDMPVHLHADRSGRIAWGLDLPPQAVCEADDVLRDACEKALAGDTYENLCVQYVAATRPKYALYILSEKLKDDSKARNFNRLLHETLPRKDDIFLVGNENWHAGHQRHDQPHTPPWIPLEGRPHQEPQHDRPSQDTRSRDLEAAKFLVPNSGLALGAEVHQFLAGIEWNGKPATENLPPEVKQLAENFLETETAARIFRKPAGEPILWREQAFDVLVEGRWISGVFDRAVIYPDHAEIFDFKTEEGDLLKIHHEQMTLYRKGLAALAGLPVSAITATLVSVKTGRTFSLED